MMPLRQAGYLKDGSIGVELRARPPWASNTERARIFRAQAGLRVGVLDDDAGAIAFERPKEGAGADLGALGARQRGDRTVELLASGRVGRTQREGIGPALRRERQPRRVAVDDRARQRRTPRRTRAAVPPRRRAWRRRPRRARAQRSPRPRARLRGPRCRRPDRTPRPGIRSTPPGAGWLAPARPPTLRATGPCRNRAKRGGLSARHPEPFFV